MKKEIPILMSTPMVQAILEGRKTLTRRIVTEKTALAWLEPDMFTPTYVASPDNKLCRYGYKGDLIYVKETFFAYGHWTSIEDSETGERKWIFIDLTPASHFDYHYMDKPPLGIYTRKQGKLGWHKRPSLFMPKKAARIWLEITDLRVEQLQDISESDAIAEGILSFRSSIDHRPRYKDYGTEASGYGHPDHDYPSFGVPITSFATLWQSINGEESWQANPYVWVIEFKVLSTTGKPVI